GVRVRRRAARARARRPGAAACPAPVLLEEREVAARDRAARRRRARILGGLRLPQLRRPMERAAVRRRLTWQLASVVEFVREDALGGCQRAREFPSCAHENSPPSWAGLRAARSVCRRSRWRRMR